MIKLVATISVILAFTKVFAAEDEKIDIKDYDPWALVTGGNSGIGEKIAEGLAKRGINIVIVARRDDLSKKLASTI